MRALVRMVRRSIALKLTLTLVGFVAVTSLVAGVYLTRALESFAVESLETRLGSVAAVVHDEARALLRAAAPASRTQDLAVRVARATGARVTFIAPDGRVLAESERALADVAALENHAARPEVREALAGWTGSALRRSSIPRLRSRTSRPCARTRGARRAPAGPAAPR
jgi:two-component system phosphate regulon sensor histidine kinase PhoR